MRVTFFTPLAFLLQHVVGKALRIYAAIFLGIGGVALTVAWQNGPQRLIDANEFATLTSRSDGRIVESWLALDWDPAAMGGSTRWRAFARAAPCAVVEYDGDWGAMRRAFCGRRLPFYSHYTVHDVKELSPRVPFDWMRDASGLRVPEIRINATAHAWLAAQPSDNFFLQAAKPRSTWEELRFDLDRPVDSAIVSWSTPVPVFALALDPQRPASALPAGFVDAGRAEEPNWALMLIPGALGLAAWFAGMHIFLSHLVPVARVVLGIVPLAFLPWWGEAFPRALRHIHADFGSVVADMMGDIDTKGRLVASEPEQARQAGGERMTWKVSEGVYAQTFGKIRFTRPSPLPADADAALALIAQATASQVRAMPARERIEIFEQLTSEKKRDLRGAGFAFLPAAREAVLDPGEDAAVRQAAAQFLSEWVTQPVEEVTPEAPGYTQRLRMLRELTTLPIPVIANPAGWILERGEKRRKP